MKKEIDAIKKEVKDKTGEISTSLVNTYTGIAKNITAPRILMYGVGIIALVGSIYWLKKMFATSDDQQREGDLNDVIKKEEAKGNRLSYSLAEFSLMADAIQEATDNTGTEDEAVYMQFDKLKNNTDLLQLIKTYGSRFNYSLISAGYYTLLQLMHAEGIYDNVKQILVSKNITVQF